jgi:hypothetical protein
MGTWGPENLSSDGAFDILHERSEALLKEIIQLAETREATEYDEHSHDLLFVLFETLFALDRHGLIRTLPESEEATIVKDCYLERWDAYMKKNGQQWDERRAVIQKTFERFERMCRRDERRSQNAPLMVELETRSIRELAPDLQFSPHVVFGRLHLSLPTSWATSNGQDATAIPKTTLTALLPRGATGSLKIGSHEFQVERVFLATGPSLVPDKVGSKHDPYLLLIKLRFQRSQDGMSLHGLAMQTEKDLAPLFPGDGEHISGVVSPDVHEGFDFFGVESFRHIGQAPDWGTLLIHQDLYFHELAENELLLLEHGSVRDNVDSNFPDRILIDHLVDSMRPAAG